MHFLVRCRAFVSNTEFNAVEKSISLEIQVTVLTIMCCVKSSYLLNSVLAYYGMLVVCFRTQMVLQFTVCPESWQMMESSRIFTPCQV